MVNGDTSRPADALPVIPARSARSAGSPRRHRQIMSRRRQIMSPREVPFDVSSVFCRLRRLRCAMADLRLRIGGQTSRGLMAVFWAATITECGLC
jgi:hypothetical protein